MSKHYFCSILATSAGLRNDPEKTCQSKNKDIGSGAKIALNIMHGPIGHVKWSNLIGSRTNHLESFRVKHASAAGAPGLFLGKDKISSNIYRHQFFPPMLSVALIFAIIS